MPEGDTIHYAANRIRPVMQGHVPDEIVTPHPRFARDRWPERLAGRAVKARDGNRKRFRRIHNGAGRPCPRCGAASVIRSRGQGDGNRTTYWCPRCQS